MSQKDGVDIKRINELAKRKRNKDLQKMKLKNNRNCEKLI